MAGRGGSLLPRARRLPATSHFAARREGGNWQFTLVTDAETLVINVVAAPTAEDLDAEGAGEEEAASGEEAAAEGEAAEEAAAESE